MASRRLIIGMSGASGAPLAVEVLKQLREEKKQVEIHLVVSRGAELTLRQEMGWNMEQLAPYADVIYDNNDIGAAIASGSFRTLGMIVVPCSMKTVAGIVSGYSDSLLLRAADVTLKERRKLVLAAREAPLGTVHLRNLYEASKLGAVILPPMMTWYNHPQSMEEATAHIARRILSQFDLDEDSYEWKGM